MYLNEAAKMLEDEKEQVERKGYKAKLQYELKLEKVKIASKWEYISRQITGTISKMLLTYLPIRKSSPKDKISIPYNEWNNVINSGQVAKMILRYTYPKNKVLQKFGKDIVIYIYMYLHRLFWLCKEQYKTRRISIGSTRS